MRKKDTLSKALMSNCRKAGELDKQELGLNPEYEAWVWDHACPPDTFRTGFETKDGRGINSLKFVYEEEDWVTYERTYRPGFYEDWAMRNKDFFIYYRKPEFVSGVGHTFRDEKGFHRCVFCETQPFYTDEYESRGIIDHVHCQCCTCGIDDEPEPERRKTMEKYSVHFGIEIGNEVWKAEHIEDMCRQHGVRFDPTGGSIEETERGFCVYEPICDDCGLPGDTSDRNPKCSCGVKVCLTAKNTGSGKRQDCVMFSLPATIRRVGGESFNQPDWGNAAYDGWDILHVHADVVLEVNQYRDRHEAKAIRGEVPEGLNKVLETQWPGDVAGAYGLVIKTRA